MSANPHFGPTLDLSLKAAFDDAHARREADRRALAEAERRQQEEDLGRAEQLYDILAGDPEFLSAHGLTVDWRRYTVALNNSDFRIAAYFEAGKAAVTSSDKRAGAAPGSPAPRKREEVDSVAEAVRVMAQFLLDETN